MLRNANNKERMKSHNTNGFIIHIYELFKAFADIWDQPELIGLSYS